MKKILLLLLILPNFVISQIDKVQTENKVEYFIDSLKVDFTKIYLNGNNIEKINIVKNGDGQIFISLKENNILDKLSDLDYGKISLIENPIFIINNKIIYKPSEILIDKTEIGELKIIDNEKIENNNGNFSIIKITTLTELNLIKENNKGNIKIKGFDLTKVE
jgi:hypothetical protein